MSAPTDQDLIGFVVHEARLIDQHRFEEWLDLFADDGYYWMPLEWGQTDPRLATSLMYEDKLLLRIRIERLKGNRTFSQKPKSRCHHVLQVPQIDRRDEAANEYVTWTPMHYVETRLDEQDLYAAWATHTLAVIDGKLKIKLKRVDLVNCDAALPQHPAFHVSTGMSERPVAIVTGGSAGIGATICRRMLDAGYEVVSLARRRPEWSHPALHAVEVDLTDAHATEQAAAERRRSNIAVGTVIHNAGVDPRQSPRRRATGGFARSDAASPRRGDSHRAGGSAGHARAQIRPHRADSSRAALGLQTRTAYSATKAGMIGMARTWALELAPVGITVNVVAPGPIGDTEMFREVIPAGSEREAALAKSIPVGRLGRSDDVARAVMFFADPENSFITGQVLYVCGGASVASISL